MSAPVTEHYDLQTVAALELAATAEMMPLTRDRKVVLLNTLVDTGGNVTKAARLLGMSRVNVWRWCQSDPVFKQLFDEAIEAGTDNLEERAYRRAMTESDRMIELLLKARRPEKYREAYKVDVSQELSDEDVTRILQQVCSAIASKAEERRLAELDQRPVIEATVTNSNDGNNNRD